MIVFKNILNCYLIHINFKSIYYHLYKTNVLKQEAEKIKTIISAGAQIKL